MAAPQQKRASNDEARKRKPTLEDEDKKPPTSKPTAINGSDADNQRHSNSISISTLSILVPSNTRHMRYSNIDCQYVNAVDDNGLNIHTQEMMQVLDHEGWIPKITKRNDTGRYQKLEDTAFTQGEDEECEIIVVLKHVSPWDFSRDNAGWSGEDRAT